jgi:hypothetical protein
VPVAIILVAVVILAGIVVVAMGHGGELARPAADEPDATDFTSWSDVASYRPPAALLGYHAGATEHALQRISRTLAERDAEIAWLRLKLRELQPEGERQGGRLAGLSVPVPAEPSPRPAPSPRPEPAAQLSDAPGPLPEAPGLLPEAPGLLPEAPGPPSAPAELPEGPASAAPLPAEPKAQRSGPADQEPAEPERPAGSVARALAGDDK